MSWYIVKHESEKQWAAYQLSQRQAKSVVEGYQIRGPFKSFILAWIAADREYQKVKVRPA